MKPLPLFSTDLKLQNRSLGENRWVVTPRGSIDSLTSERFKNELEALFQQHKTPPHLLLDMSEVKYISSLGLGALLSWFKRTKEAGSMLALYDVTLAVKRVLEISKLDFLLIQPDKLNVQNPFAEYILSEEPVRRKRREEAEARKKESTKKNTR